MKVYYDSGPDLLSFPGIGSIRKNQVKDIDDAKALLLIEKGRLKPFDASSANFHLEVLEYGRATRA